jgi:uncharacterized phiE125 gp8 family phage protein
MAGRLKLITPPASEPVTAADLKAYGRIPSDAADADLVKLIKSAREAAEKHLNRALITQTWELVYDGFPCLPLAMPMPPLATLVSINVTDINGATTALTLSDFIVDVSGVKGSLALKYGKFWPSLIPEYAGVAIRFTCGYGEATAVPERMATVIKLGALWYYDHPDEALPQGFFDELNPDRVVPV